MELCRDFLHTPPQEVRATCTFAIPVSLQGSAPLPSSSPGQAGSLGSRDAYAPPSFLARLMTVSHFTFGMGLLSLFAAFGLGAFHALEPGHGKTLVAAYLVGSRGTVWHAVLLGLVVTASHTLVVYLLGAIALFAAHSVMPEDLYPWLELASGLLITGLGIALFTKAWRRSFRSSHVHPHSHLGDSHRRAHPHDHSHTYPSNHLHGSSRHHGECALAAVGYGTLFTLGVTGGMVPCPAAIVVLLSAVAFQRIAFGLLLIVAFSLGLATVLVAIGLVCVSARGLLQRWGRESRWQTYLPFLAPLVITPLGLILVLRSLSGFRGAVLLSF